MAITLNPATRVFTVPQADLTFVSGTLYELDTEVAFRQIVNQLMDDEDYIWMPDPISHNTEVTVAGVTYARFVEMINSYSITFTPDSQWSVRLIGSNNNLFDIEALILNQNQVQVIPNNSAGLTVPITVDGVSQGVWEYLVNGTVDGSFGETVKNLAYQNMVSIDSNGGSAGTTYPIGTVESPVNNIEDALIIAANIGTVLLKVEEDLTIGAAVNLDGYHVSGHHATKNQITIVEGCSTNLCQFDNILLTGNLDGQIVIRDSLMEDIIDFQGVAHQCMLLGTIELCGSLPPGQQIANAQSFFLNCYSAYAGETTPEIDMDSTGYATVFRDYSGGIKFINKSGPEPVSVDFVSGTLILDSTVTQGAFNVRGVYELQNNSTGTTTVKQATNLDDVPQRVWDRTKVLASGTAGSIGEFIADELTIIDNVLINRTETNPVTGIMTIFAKDDVTPLYTSNIWENVAATTPYAGNAVNRRNRLT